MESCAYLGPETNFSGQFVRTLFASGSVELLPVEGGFEKLLDFVELEKANFAIVPFENNNGGAVQRLQLELFKRGGKLFVSDIWTYDVVHYLYSTSDVEDIKEIRTMEPVCMQVTDWVNKHLPKATLITDGYKCTSEAIESIVDSDPNFGLAAIGSEEARKYGVPCIVQEIQNVPNFTTFCKVQKLRPDLNGAHRLLAVIECPTEEDRRALDDMLNDGLCVTFQRETPTNPPFLVVEIASVTGGGILSSSHAGILEKYIRKGFFLGCYAGKSLTVEFSKLTIHT